MITIAVALYAFLAGMTAEWMHTTIKAAGVKEYLILSSLVWGVLWPVTLWRLAS